MVVFSWIIESGIRPLIVLTFIAWTEGGTRFSSIETFRRMNSSKTSVEPPQGSGKFETGSRPAVSMVNFMRAQLRLENALCCACVS